MPSGSSSQRRRTSRTALGAILSSIAGIQEVVAGKTLTQYSQDWLTRHAVERGMEIISEATRRLPAALLKQHPEINWKQIMGMGNVLRHDYDDIVDEVIFDAAVKRLPALKAAILAIEANLDEPDE
jgi:uncharacterized protein with HEPN domain